MYTFFGRARVKSHVHILGGGEGGVGGCTFLAGGGSKTIYAFFDRGRVKSHVHIPEEGVHIHWQGEG